MQIPVKQTVVVSVPVPTVLTLIFVVLKLVGEIDWPWFWVLSPLWITFVAVGGMLTMFAVLMIVFATLISTIDR